MAEVNNQLHKLDGPELYRAQGKAVVLKAILELEKDMTDYGNRVRAGKAIPPRELETKDQQRRITNGISRS